MADWSGVYTFDSVDDLSVRVRRLERGRQYFRAGNLVTSSGSLAALPKDLLDDTNKIALISGVSAKGSIPPSGVVGNFAFTATTTTITIYWDGTNGSVKLSLIRTDGTAVQIPANSLTVTGLTAGTTYGFLPFWSPFNNCGIGFVVGDSGTPKCVFSSAAQTVTNSMQQLQLGREALTAGYITFATPSSGTSGGTGTGGGFGGVGGTCIMLGTDIKPMVTGQPFRTIHHRQTDWINLAIEDYPRTLNCTPNHPLYHAEKGKMRAEQFKVGDWIITERGEMKLAEVRQFYKDCTKVQVELEAGHMFYANGFLSHNFKPDRT